MNDDSFPSPDHAKTALNRALISLGQPTKPGAGGMGGMDGGGDVGAAVRARRAELGMSLQEVATRVGCARSYLSMIETGARDEVSEAILGKLEKALGFARGELLRAAQWSGAPASVKRRVREMSETHRAAAATLRATIGSSLDDAYRSGRLEKLVTRLEGSTPPIEMHSAMAALPVQVPLINSVAAGYPREFTDLGYPARVADEYVRTPDVLDPDAFAARVVGASMLPDYREGDIVVFSPAREVKSGMDCFVRFEKDEESTFKRVEIEEGAVDRAEGRGEEEDAGTRGRGEGDGETWIKLIALNPKYPTRRVRREEIAGMYAAVSVTRKIGG